MNDCGWAWFYCKDHLMTIDIFKEKTKENPILLLDDIFSELDDIKKNNVIKYIKSGIQTMITTTDLNISLVISNYNHFEE